MKIIPEERSIIPSADVKNIRRFKELIKQTHDIEGIGGYKLNSALAILHSLPRLVRIVREFTDKPVIYDHQKWMTDVPHTGKAVVEAVKKAGASAIIGYPLSGPDTQESNIRDAQESGLGILVGGEMTNPRFKTSEGGYISDDALDGMYLLSARLGVTNFVVPGNNRARVEHYLKILEPVVKDRLSFWAPGFVAQGGSITEAARAAGRSFHAIVGRAIFEADDMRDAAMQFTSQLGGQ